jgi:hypothetical protein
VPPGTAPTRGLLGLRDSSRLVEALSFLHAHAAILL